MGNLVLERVVLGAALLAAPACGTDAYPAPAEPGEQYPGGKTTVPVLSRANAFTFPVDNISAEHERLFQSGNRLFNLSWVTAPSSTDGFDGVGPLFNARSCSTCHFKDGRGAPPSEPDEPFSSMLLRIGTGGRAADGSPLPDPHYGGQLQPAAISDVPAEGRPRVSYSERSGQFDDGEPFTLLVPHYTIEQLGYGEPGQELVISPRVAPAMIGLGLLEAISEERLQQLADPDDLDADGISGRINYVPDVTSGTRRPGRFGWKAEQPSIRQQSAGAFLGDMGISSDLFPAQECTDVQIECASAITGGAPELEAQELDRVVLYGHLLGVPRREVWDTEVVLAGKRLFSEVGCASCHTPRHTTGDAEFDELSFVEVRPYTDLLLHDMGPELSDERPSFEAEGNEWRTPPLWGNRLVRDVNGHNRLLHDGRARGLAEAILWHGGEAQAARDAFVALSKAEREALILFVESL